MYPRCNRLVDSSPKHDIHRCDEVSRPSGAERLILEFASGCSIGGNSMQATTLSFPNCGSGSDAFEIFKSDRSQSVFGFSDYPVGNVMVNVFGEPEHLARKLLIVKCYCTNLRKTKDLLNIFLKLKTG
jgi:hypothetical protein